MIQSFKDKNGNIISFESIKDITLEEQKDIVTNETTAYLVRI